MKCPFCNEEIEENARFCQNCGAKIPDFEEETINHIDESRERTLEGFKSVFESKLFLGLLVSLAIYAASGVLTTLFSLVNGIFAVAECAVFNLIPAIFAGMAAYGGLRLYNSSGNLLVDDMKKLEEYPRIMYGYQIAYTVIAFIISAFSLIIVAGVLFVFGAVGDFDAILTSIESFAQFESDEAQSVLNSFEWFVREGGFIIMLLLLFVIALVITVFVFSAITYKKTKNYYQMLTETLMGSEFNFSIKLPTTYLYVFGSLNIVSGVLTLLDNVLAALPVIASGAYLIITALIMRNLSYAVKDISKRTF